MNKMLFFFCQKEWATKERGEISEFWEAHLWCVSRERL